MTHSPLDPFSQYKPENPFLSAQSPETVRERDGWSLSASAETIDEGEISSERPHAVEILIIWGNSVLHVAHLSPPRTFVVGEVSDGSGEPIDAHLPEGLIGRRRLPLVLVEEGMPYLILPDIARGTLHTETGVLDISADLGTVPACHTLPRAKQCVLNQHTRLAMKLGEIEVCIRLVTQTAPFKRGLLAGWDSAVPSYFALTAATFGGFMAALAYFVPPLGLMDEDTLNKQRFLAISQYLDASSEREQEQREEPVEQTSGQDSGQAAQGSDGPAGAVGKEESTEKNKRVAVKGPRENRELQLSQREALILARDFGLVGILNAHNAADPNAPKSVFGRDVTLGNDDLSANGALWANDIGESLGNGGLTLSGPGQGGGFLNGTSIGIANIGEGLLGPGRGKDGWGMDRGLGKKGHNTRAPSVRPEGETILSGRMPAHVVQRIVRQNFGRFRFCYEQGLGKNPGLEGRLSVRFVIARDGSVSNVSSAGGFPDAAVQSCVQSAFYGLSFPEPEGGIVTVTYPLMLTPG